MPPSFLRTACGRLAQQVERERTPTADAMAVSLADDRASDEDEQQLLIKAYGLPEPAVTRPFIIAC